MAKRRCVMCGKLIFHSEEEANQAAQKELKLHGRAMKTYECTRYPGVWHLSTKNVIISTQLVLGGLTKDHVMILRMPDRTEYLVVSPFKGIRPIVLDIFDRLVGEHSKTPEIAILCIAKKMPNSEIWLSQDSLVSSLIPKHQHRILNVLREISNSSMFYSTANERLGVIELFASQCEIQVTNLQPKLIRMFCQLDPDYEYVPEQAEEEFVGPLYVEQEVKERIIKERRFIILHKEGIEAWESIRNSLPTGVTMSQHMEKLIIELASTLSKENNNV